MEVTLAASSDRLKAGVRCVLGWLSPRSGMNTTEEKYFSHIGDQLRSSRPRTRTPDILVTELPGSPWHRSALFVVRDLHKTDNEMNA
jgi:hypothetical protein